MKIIYTWDNTNFSWNNNPYTWDEVALITQASDGIFDVDQWDKEKKKKLVKLICKVKGKTYDESKYVNDFKIKVSDIKLAAKEILGVEIMTENIKF
mgnify:CR=1 FL=1